jgi:hypothetical protein
MSLTPIQGTIARGQQMKRAGISRTHRHTVFVFKYWAALLLFASAFLMAGDDLFTYPARIPVVLALAFWGLFSVTAAEVRIEPNSLMYRRFVRWHRIPYADIHEARLCLWPVYGFVKSKRFIPPWGRLYFVTARSAFTGRPRDLVLIINSRRKVAE